MLAIRPRSLTFEERGGSESDIMRQDTKRQLERGLHIDGSAVVVSEERGERRESQW